MYARTSITERGRPRVRRSLIVAAGVASITMPLGLASAASAQSTAVQALGVTNRPPGITSTKTLVGGVVGGLPNTAQGALGKSAPNATPCKPNCDTGIGPAGTAVISGLQSLPIVGAIAPPLSGAKAKVTASLRRGKARSARRVAR